ncbi:alpha/beta-hydrolase [Auricularia subglabra TFB-10046 SS5]|nr:alpha/beta-hydrolase [Auricularia subglabra TFB-10046 SS5]
MATFPRGALLSALLAVPAFALRRDFPFPPISHLAQAADANAFDWYALKPADNITWTPCFDGQQCARLNLPLDHSTPNGPKIQVALQMIPAADKEHYQGSILVNPGGPGGAGTQFVLTGGQALVEIFGPTFDILGFDPRGVGATTPRADCVGTDPQRQAAWANSEVLSTREGDGSIPLTRAHNQVRGELCAAALGGDSKEEIGGSVESWGPGRFMDTASVVEDMVNIIQQLGQGKLHYYGASYGTLLGQYFAAIHPEKVGRMIIDGVIDGAKWQPGKMADCIEDTDAIMDQFYEGCVKAGRSRCAVWEPTPRAVARRLDRALDALKQEPIPLPFHPGGPTTLTFNRVAAYIFQTGLYFPSFGFTKIADAAWAIETRNASHFADFTLTKSFDDVPVWMRDNDAFSAVMCTDFPPLNDTLAEEVADLKTANRLSRWGGPYFAAQIRFQCGAWKIQAKHRYAGPVSSKLEVPALVVSSRYDPVTPLSNAKAVATRNGWRLLLQESSGHTSAVFINPRSCVATALRVYMTNGTLPAMGTVCESPATPFLDPMAPESTE